MKVEEWEEVNGLENEVGATKGSTTVLYTTGKDGHLEKYKNESQPDKEGRGDGSFTVGRSLRTTVGGSQRGS